MRAFDLDKAAADGPESELKVRKLIGSTLVASHFGKKPKEEVMKIRAMLITAAIGVASLLFALPAQAQRMGHGGFHGGYRGMGGMHGGYGGRGYGPGYARHGYGYGPYGYHHGHYYHHGHGYYSSYYYPYWFPFWGYPAVYFYADPYPYYGNYYSQRNEPVYQAPPAQDHTYEK